MKVVFARQIAVLVVTVLQQMVLVVYGKLEAMYVIFRMTLQKVIIYTIANNNKLLFVRKEHLLESALITQH
jgi:hypothetical protein